MNEEDLRQNILDTEHLRLLSLCYLVMAGVTAFFSLFALIYVAVGVMITTAASRGGMGPGGPPPAVGMVITIIGLAIFCGMILMAALKFAAGRCLKKRRARVFCLVVAGLSCLGIPYGTLLGIFTFLVLGRPSVRQMFEEPEAPPPGAA